MDNTVSTAEKTKFCKHCGAKIAEAAVICTHCGCQVEETPKAEQPNIVINNTNTNANTNINAAMLGNVRDNMKILHPLPRVTEISQDVDETPYAYYFKQAENGLYVRMAIISYLLGYR